MVRGAMRDAMPHSPPREAEELTQDDQVESTIITSERAPLLSRSSSEGQDTGNLNDQRRGTAAPQSGFSANFWFCIALELLCEFSTMILAVPMVSLLEQAICQRHYHHDHWVDPSDSGLCKVPAVQRTVAQVRGWKAFFDTLSAILVALPMGRIADRRSQRAVFAVIIIGMLMALTWTLIVATQMVFPIRLVWTSSIFLLVGGGNYAAEMILGVMVAKACSEETRTRGLYYYYSCFIFSELIAPPIASWTAGVSLWLPFAISYFSLVLTFPVLAVMPQTKNEPTTSDSNDTIAPDCEAVSNRVASLFKTLTNAMIDQFRLLNVIFANRNMLLAVPIFLVGTFRGISMRVITQYTSFRFGWKLEQTNVLISEVALVNLFLFSLILPGIISLVNRYIKPTIQALNMSIVKFSLLILFFGSLLLAFAPNSGFLVASTMIYALGFGSRSTLLSLITSWTESRTIGSLYSALFLIEQFGMLFGEPLLHNLLGVAVDLEDPLKGLPFLASGLCFFLSFICATLIKLR